jgi:hypothetical protein
MAYTESDLESAARQIKDARGRVEALTSAIMDARRAGHPTHRSETALITMLNSLEYMIRHEENVRVSLAGK